MAETSSVVDVRDGFMKIKNAFKISAPFEKTWDALDDIPLLARCAPGAELIEQRPDDSYLGSIGVKLGPVALKFKGTVSFAEKNKEAGRVAAKAKGNEDKGRGVASADVVFHVRADGDATVVDVESEIQLAGAIAQYGRGAALIQGTAQALMDQFARNLEAELSGSGSGSTGDISVTKVVAKGLWNAGTQIFRKNQGVE
jgi:carbon monoxide dehydrogenase subunit G